MDGAVVQRDAVEATIDRAAGALTEAGLDVTGLYRGTLAADAAVGPHPTGALGTERRISLQYRVDPG
jgi:hypothetical protein